MGVSYVRFVAACALIAPSAAFADVPHIPELKGQVINADTKRPISGAIVVANIGGHGGAAFGHSHDRRLYCIAVRTDAEGRFRIPAWTWSGGRSMSLDGFGANLIAYHPDYTFHVPGGLASVHQSVRKFPLLGTVLKPSEATIPMRRFTPSDSQAWRFKLGLPIDWFGCDWDGDVQNEDLLWDAMLEEVEAFDAANPTVALRRKLELTTKRPQPPPPKPAPVDRVIRSPTAPASSAPQR